MRLPVANLMSTTCTTSTIHDGRYPGSNLFVVHSRQVPSSPLHIFFPSATETGPGPDHACGQRSRTLSVPTLPCVNPQGPVQAGAGKTSNQLTGRKVTWWCLADLDKRMSCRPGASIGLRCTKRTTTFPSSPAANTAQQSRSLALDITVLLLSRFTFPI